MECWFSSGRVLGHGPNDPLSGQGSIRKQIALSCFRGTQCAHMLLHRECLVWRCVRPRTNLVLRTSLFPRTNPKACPQGPCPGQGLKLMHSLLVIYAGSALLGIHIRYIIIEYVHIHFGSRPARFHPFWNLLLCTRFRKTELCQPRQAWRKCDHFRQHWGRKCNRLPPNLQAVAQPSPCAPRRCPCKQK